MTDYSFNMTAGTGSGFTGYSDGSLIGAFGSIDAEPISGETLAAVISGPFDVVSFTGDVTSLISTHTVWVDGVEYPGSWSFTGSTTDYTYDSTTPTFSNGVDYDIELKAPVIPPGVTHTGTPTTSTTGTISLPTGAAAGDLAVLSYATKNTASAAPGIGTPSGWSNGANIAQPSGVFVRHGMAYKVLNAGDITAGSVTLAATGNDFNRQRMHIFRPDSGYEISAITLSPADTANRYSASTGNPSALVLDGSSHSAPVVIVGFALQEAGDTVSFSTESPAFDATGTAGAANMLVGYKVYNSSPADLTIDIGDSGAYNILRGLVLALTLDAVSGDQDLTPSLVTDGDTFHGPTASATYGLAPALFSDGDTFHSATITTGAVALTPSLYADGDTFYSATVAAAAVDLAPALFSDGDSFHSATVAATVELTAALYQDDDTFYSATVAGGAAVLVPSLFVDDDTFHDAAVTVGSVDLAPSLFADGDTFYTHAALSTYALTAALFSDGDTFHDASVAVGAVDLQPDVYTDGDSFHSATVEGGAVTLSPDLFADGDTFYSHTLAATYALEAPHYTDADSFHSATVEPGAINLLPSAFSDADTFFDATVTVGAVALAPALFTDADVFHAATVGATYALTVDYFDDGDTFHSATVEVPAANLSAPYIDDPDTFYPATVSPGAIDLAPALFADGDTFYSASLLATYDLTAPHITDADTFFGPTVVRGDFFRPQDVRGGPKAGRGRGSMRAGKGSGSIRAGRASTRISI